MIKDSKSVDTLHMVETPEGALLRIAVAGPIARGMAWFVDGCIRMTILFSLLIFFSSSLSRGNSIGAGFGLFFIAQFLLNWFYTTAFEAMTSTTPGKRLFGLWVVHDNATPITWTGSLTRNFLRVIDGLPFFNVIGLITMIIDGRFRRLGDLAAGTLVIYRDKLPSAPTFKHHAGKPPPDWLSREERAMIVDFAERTGNLSVDRQKELAEVLAHLIDDTDDHVDTLKSWAHWIIRGQDDTQPKSL